MLNNKILINEQVKHMIRLPYPGDILVNIGDEVSPKTMVARSELIKGIPAYFNVLSMLKIKLNQFESSVTCSAGEFVRTNAVLARYKDRVIRAPFKGWIEYVSYSNGYILLRQLVKRNDKPRIVEAAKLLGIRPGVLKNVVLVKEGQNVVRKQGLAGDLQVIQSPMAGTVEKIDFTNGNIVIKPHYTPTELISGINGYVTDVEPQYAVEISTSADILYGAFGAGVEATGKLVFNLDDIDSSDPAILVLNGRVTAEKLKEHVIVKKLRKWDKKNVVGIIAASINAEDIIQIFGDSVYEGVTGKEEFPVSLIITEKFGDHQIDTDILNHLQKYKGSLATIYPESNCHPPIKQPKMFLYNN